MKNLFVSSAHRVLSLMLTAAIIFSCVPLSAVAQHNFDAGLTVEAESASTEPETELYDTQEPGETATPGATAAAPSGAPVMFADVTVYDFAGLQSAIAAYEDTYSDITITIGADITIIDCLIIPKNFSDRILTIKSDGTHRTLKRGVAGSLITIDHYSRISLENITIDGDNTNTYEYNRSLIDVINIGQLIMNDGAVLQNNSTSGGGGVSVLNGGVFKMEGGTIKNNNASGIGGGVFVSGGTFTMSGGEINGNKATSQYYGGGGGVYLDDDGAFAMTGGKIIGNIADGADGDNGSGVYVHNGTYTVGGTAVVKGNTKLLANNNVHLARDKYITLGTGSDAPSQGMEVYVHGLSGKVIVNSGASAEQEKYFKADYDHLEVVYDNNGKLMIAKIVPTVTGVTVNPASADVQESTSYHFSATVNGTDNPTQSVTWTVTGQASASTYISDIGQLNVGSDETATTITVTATSTLDTSKSGTATVTVC